MYCRDAGQKGKTVRNHLKTKPPIMSVSASRTLLVFDALINILVTLYLIITLYLISVSKLIVN